MFPTLHLEELDNIISILEGRIREHALHFTAQPNGFRCISFGPQYRDRPQIRLHIWPGGVIEGDIHDHAWDYSSLCVFGKIEMTTYVEAGSGTLYAHYTCSSSGAAEDGSKKLEFEFLRRTYLRPLSVRAVTQGETYNQVSSQLHQVVATSEEEFAAITLMKRDSYLRNFTNVYSIFVDTDQAHFQRINKEIPFDPKSNEIIRCIEELRKYRRSLSGYIA